MSPKGCENVARKSFYIKVLIELTVKLGFSELFFSLSVFCNDTCVRTTFEIKSSFEIKIFISKLDFISKVVLTYM